MTPGLGSHEHHHERRWGAARGSSYGWHIDVFVRDRVSGPTTLVSLSSSGVQGMDDESALPSLFADGRFVGFSTANDLADLVPDDTLWASSVFVRGPLH